MSSDSTSEVVQQQEDKAPSTTAGPQPDTDTAMMDVADTHDVDVASSPSDAPRSTYNAPIAGNFAEYNFLELRQLAAARKAARDVRDAQMEKLVHHTAATNKRKSSTTAASSSSSLSSSTATAATKRPPDNRNNHLSRAQKAQKAANKQTIAEAIESARILQKEKQAERAAAAANATLSSHSRQPTPHSPLSKSSRNRHSANGRAGSRASAALPGWLVGDESAAAVPLPSFIKRGTSLDLVVSEKQVRGWVAEAVDVWQRMAEEKRRLYGPKQRKFAAVGQQNGAKAAPTPRTKQQQAAATPKPALLLERKPSIVLPPPILEDTLLPSYATHSALPTSSSLFTGLSSRQSHRRRASI